MRIIRTLIEPAAAWKAPLLCVTTIRHCVNAGIGVAFKQQSRVGYRGRIMVARSAAASLLRVSKGLQKGFRFLAARVKALRHAVRIDDFRLAQRLRMALPLYVRHLKEPLRNDLARLFEVTGLWVRNVGDRRQTKRHIQRISRRVIQRLDAQANSLSLRLAPS